MDVTLHADATALLRHAGDRLTERPTESFMLLGILRRLERGDRWGGDPAVLASIDADGEPVMVAVQTPPYPMMMRDLGPAPAPDATIDALIAGLLAHGVTPPGVNTERELAGRFADRWCRATGARPRRGMEMRSHILREVADIPPSPGRARLAGEADVQLVADWYEAFVREALPDEAHAVGDQRAVATKAVAEGHVLLWEDAGPVSMAGGRFDLETVAKVAPVYTPPELRGRGYGTSCVAELTRRLLARGAHGVCLFTNLANPTSNAIYRRIGYRPTQDWVQVWFD